MTLLANSNLSSAGFERYITDFVMHELEEIPFHENQKLEEEALGFNVKYNLSALIMKSDNI